MHTALLEVFFPRVTNERLIKAMNACLQISQLVVRRENVNRPEMSGFCNAEPQ